MSIPKDKIIWNNAAYPDLHTPRVVFACNRSIKANNTFNKAYSR